MKLSIIGTGYVGLVSGACFAKLGNDVVCVDIDKEKVEKINKGISPIYEQGLEDLLQKHKDSIRATSSYKVAIKDSDVTFICVGTPSQGDGSIDLSFVEKAAEKVGEQLKDKDGWHLVVVKSTVLPGTTRDIVLPILERFSDKKAGDGFGMAMNPEFLREGFAVNDFLDPDRVVVGVYDERSRKVLKRLYEGFDCPVLFTGLSAAEMIKYGSNALLATKISFINEIGNMCKKHGVDTYEVADGIGLDSRIKRDFLDSGIGWGGSCLPKDTRALSSWGKKNGLDVDIVDSIIKVNDRQPLKTLELLKKHVSDLNGKCVGVLGLAFKPGTDDIRYSRSIPIVKSLLEEDVRVKVFDPQAMENFKKLFPDLVYCSSPSEVLDSDAVIIATKWKSFKELDFSGKIVIDGRRLKVAEKDAKVYEGVCW